MSSIERVGLLISRLYGRGRPAGEAASEPVRPSLTAAAVILAAGFLGSRVLGVVRSVAIANSFGTSPELGAYWVAFRLPDMVFQLLAGATLGSAFIPAFARLYTTRSEREAWRLASSVLNLLAGLTVVVAILGVLFAPLLVPVMAPGLGEDSGRQAELQGLAVNLTRILMVSPVLFAVSGMFMSILNARHHFFWPAIAPMVYNIAIIVGALVSSSVYGLAIAVVAGAALHLAVQLPALGRVGMRFSLIADWKDAAVREVARLMTPRMVGLAAVQFNFLITIFFASTVSDEAISGVNYGWLVVMTPLGLFGIAIAQAVFPTLAEQAALGGERLREMIGQALRLILFLTIPSSVGLIILAGPLVRFLFQHGAFTSASTDVTVAALVFYSIGLFAHSGTEILSRGFYSLSDTRTPVAFSVGSMVLNLVLSLILVRPLGVRGLGLSVSLAAMVEFGLLLTVLDRRVGGLDLGRLRASVARTGAATIVMAEVVGLFLLLLHGAGHLNTASLADAVAALGGGALLGAGAYFGAAFLLGSEEAETLRRRLPALRPAALA